MHTSKLAYNIMYYRVTSGMLLFLK